MSYKVLNAALVLALTAGAAGAGTRTVEMMAITAEGFGSAIGQIVISDSPGGLSLHVAVAGIPDGEHGFHIHTKGDCGPGLKDGKNAAGVAAGDHYDPLNSKSHKGPGGSGRRKFLQPPTCVD
jgi:superoxide dismutase, Cu-Zn family